MKFAHISLWWPQTSVIWKRYKTSYFLFKILLFVCRSFDGPRNFHFHSLWFWKSPEFVCSNWISFEALFLVLCLFATCIIIRKCVRLTFVTFLLPQNWQIAVHEKGDAYNLLVHCLHQNIAQNKLITNFLHDFEL